MILDSPIRRLVLLAGLALGLLPNAQAQWLTQSFRLKPGWNAIYSHVDATHDSLENVVGATSPISEIWLWKDSPAEGRIVQNPGQYVTGRDWVSWSKAIGPTDAFSIRGNTAYLVRNTGPTDYLWNIKGKPVPPVVRWTSTGLNLIGFPTRSESAPRFSDFLSPAPAWSDFQLFHYRGGEGAGAPPKVDVLATLSGTDALRGRAVWLKKRDNSDNRYYGPFELVLQDFRGVVFSESVGAYSLRLRNALDATNVVAATLLASEPSPTGANFPLPPLLLRTTLDSQTLQYGYTNLPPGVSRTFTLAPRGKPGSDVEVVLGLDRLAMTASAGTQFAAILRLEDLTRRHLQIDLPVLALQGSQQGLWVGEAAITHVGNYLKTYARATNAVDFTNQLTRLADLNQGNTTVQMTNALWNLHALNPTDFAGAATPQPWVALGMSSDARRRIAATELGQLVHSTDAGRSWSNGIGLGGAVALASSRNGSNWIAGVAGRSLFLSTNGGSSWIPHESNRAWVAVASSADGTRLAAAVFGGSIYVSTNSGVNWSSRGSATNWSAIASSADGSRLVAAVQDGPLVVSTDGGETWTERDGPRAWQSVAASDDGQRWIASVNGGRLYTSDDFGTTWVGQGDIRNWGAVASSANGTNLVAVEQDGRIHTSTNAGVIWTPRGDVGAWAAVASSADGLRLSAAKQDGFLYDSLDGGSNWTVTYPSIAGVASSAEGGTLLAGIRGGRLYLSRDAGTNWSSVSADSAAEWQAVASSGDGTRLGAAIAGGRAYFSADSGTNWAAAGTLPSANWTTIATAFEGLAWVLGNSDGELWASPDGGTTWARRFGRTNTVWRGIAASVHGQRWFAAPHDGPIHASSDAGMTWQTLVGSTAGRWQSIACSTNGQVVVAVENPGGIHRSIDAGVTWDTLDSVPSPVAWASIACSSDGSAMVAAPEVGPLFVSTDGGKTWNQREANRRWAGVTTSTDGTRWIAGALGETGPVLITEGRLVTPELAYDPASNRILAGGGKYLAAGFDTALGEVPTPFRLRLILHHDADGRSRLLDEVFHGPGAATNLILTVDESRLHPDFLSKARRISAVHLPFSGGGWPMVGEFGGTGILNGALTEGYDTTASNPFLHAYHPDHDNWDPLYATRVKRGDESYDIRRQITLSFAPPGDDFASRTTVGSRLQGTYLENIVLKGGGNQMRTMTTQGNFILNRISTIGTLQ